MNAAQVLTVMRDHSAIREGQLRYCACDASRARRMAPAEHTAHLAEQIAAASAGPIPSSADSAVLRARELDGEAVGYAATLPVPGIGDVAGEIAAVAPIEFPGQSERWVELTLWHREDAHLGIGGGRRRSYIVNPDAWICLARD